MPTQAPERKRLYAISDVVRNWAVECRDKMDAVDDERQEIVRLDLALQDQEKRKGKRGVGNRATKPSYAPAQDRVDGTKRSFFQPRKLNCLF